MRTIAEQMRDLANGKPAKIEWPHRPLHEAADTIDALVASCQEFLPILERQLAAVNPGGAAEGSIAFQTAKNRVERMRAALAKAEARS